MRTLSAVLLSLSLTGALGHARWRCPPARDESDDKGKHIPFDNTGNKYGACGPYSGQWGMNGYRKLKPGWQTFEWEEAVAHVGSPFRIAILDANETSRVTLLDHIPHWDSARAVPFVESTYVKYRVNVFIPDLKCEKCSIQLIYFMTDKSTKCGMEVCTYYPDDSACSGQLDASAKTCFGAPNDVPCEKPNTCFSNYHTCTDVMIEGRKAMNTDERDVDFQPTEWPYRKLEFGMYGAEAAEWKDGWLVDVPSNFTTRVGSLLC